MGSIFTKGSRQSGQSEGLSQQMADIAGRQVSLAEQQAAITNPLRQKSASILGGFLDSGQTPAFLDLPATVSPLAALSLPGLESEQNILRNRLLAQGSRGGLLQQQLGQAALQGGISRAGLQQQDLLRQEQRDLQRAGLRQSLFGSAGDMGTGGLALAFQGMSQGNQGIGNAAQNLNVLGSQRIQQNQIAQQGIGQLLGKGLGLAGGYMLPEFGAGTLGRQTTTMGKS